MVKRKSTSATDAANSIEVLRQLARLEEAFSVREPNERTAETCKGLIGGIDHKPNLLPSLHKLLEALDWPGNEKQLAEQLPGAAELNSLADIRNVLSGLGYETVSELKSFGRLEDTHFPCLTKYRGKVFVLLRKDAKGIVAFSAETNEEEFLSLETTRQIHIPLPAEAVVDTGEMASRSWINGLTRKFRSLIFKLFAVTFFVNLAALAVPLFVMVVYDKAIGTRSEDTLKYLIIGMGIILVSELALRSIRGRALAYLGTRFETLTSSRAFQRLLYLPLPAVEDAPISAQLTRLRQFENVREFFSGSMALAVLDLPFLGLFLFTIALVGGWLFVVPLSLIVLFGILAVLLVPMNRRRVALTGQSRQAAQNYHLEAVTNHRAIRENRAEDAWLHRYTDIARVSAVRHFKAEQLNLFVMTLTQFLVSAGGALTLYFGAFMVIAGEISIGALIATMALVWRCMAPLQASFLSLTRVSQVLHAFRQINFLMSVPLEREPGKIPDLARTYDGKIAIKRVNFRHANAAEPALAGLNLRVAAGETIAITGPSGAGKSVLLKVLSGLYQIRAGSVWIDDVDLRHADPGEYRHVISYVGERFDFTEGTIEENLLLANPLASELDLRRAWEDAGLAKSNEFFPDGLESYFNQTKFDRLDTCIRQQLLLARAYVKSPRIYLLDKPDTGLDPSAYKALRRKLSHLQGKATVVVVTHDVDQMRAANRVVYMQDGTSLLDGPPDEVVPTILKAA